MEIHLSGSSDEKGNFTGRWYNGELDKKLNKLEKKIEKDITKICEEHKIIILIKKHHDLELTVLIDNEKSIF
ncbi:hypothetical protein KU06062659_1100005 [Flavobacterium psychrophilum]|uniref:hypothetical protein n=1 Tax=Flavobacterium psychrophilum TaxID=96345 RepID=UPI000B7C0917|nr:hypothetical protein [Flavobacterium psychrophilum]SNB04691.1 hypothetical protein KU06062659_1100005 [Flavobacterium psychrophilum]